MAETGFTRRMELDSPLYGGGMGDHGGSDAPEPHHGNPKTSFRTLRKAVHRGVEIKVHTTYRIEIGGEPLTTHVMVDEDGAVHCHGIPNYVFTSALDMARAVVDASALARYDHDEIGGAGGHE